MNWQIRHDTFVHCTGFRLAKSEAKLAAPDMWPRRAW